MNKLFLICSLMLLGSGTAQADDPDPLSNCLEQQVVTLKTTQTSNPQSDYEIKKDVPRKFVLIKKEKPTVKELDLSSVEFIEDEVDISFDFDVNRYLPRGFNPHEPYFNIHSIEYIEDEVDITFNFDVHEYLPEGFDAHATPQIVDLNSIPYIEDEEEVTFDFDVKAYLPRGFDPYKPYFDIHSIEYIEDDVDVHFDFDVNEYLPEGFDPYATASDS